MDWINLQQKEAPPLPGIYELTGDQLRMCFPLLPKKGVKPEDLPKELQQPPARPTTFDTQGKYTLTLVAQREKEKIIVEPVFHWNGSVSDLSLKKLIPPFGLVTTRDEFEQLWKAWRGEEKIPDVDFKVYFGMVATSKGAPAGFKNVVVNPDGVGNPTFHFSFKTVDHPGFLYDITIFPREKVKTMFGKAISASP
jgi:hypothetical protein